MERSGEHHRGLSHNMRVAMMAIAALLLVLASTIYENPFQMCHHEGAVELCRINGKLFAHVALEIGFALIIAIGVTLGIEHQSREADLRAHESMRRQIAQSVFRGVFTKDLPDDYVDAVIDHVLKVDVIRDFCKLIDRIDADGQSPDKVRLARKVLYRVSNVSHGPVVHPIRFFYHTDDVADLQRSGLTTLQIDGEVFSRAQLDKLRVVDKALGQIRYEIPRTIPENGAMDVEYDLEIFKLKSDSEIWSSLAPCMKVDYSVRLSLSVRRLGMTERCITPAKCHVLDLKAGMGDWSIEGPFLRDNSLNIWWDVQP